MAKKASGRMKATRTTSAKSYDKSMHLKGPSVNKDACRKGVAKAARTLGPRTA